MKEFKQVGYRDGSICPLKKISITEEQYLKDLDNCFCPCCGKGPLNGATGINNDNSEKCVPRDGSPTICSFCTELCVFREKDGKLLVEIAPERERELEELELELLDELLLE